MMNRRRFLTQSGLAASALLPTTFTASAIRAAGSVGQEKALVVLFQRGGCDGLNTLVPYADDDYYALRPTIAIPRPGAVRGALRLDATFGLHPALSSLRPLYDQDRLAIFPAVHYANANRSHFESQDIIETAHGNRRTGWLGRFLGSSQTLLPRALSLGNVTPLSLAGAQNVLAFGNSVDVGQLPAEDNVHFIDAMNEVYSQASPDNLSLERLTRSGRSLWGEMEKLRQMSDDTPPAHGAQYPDTALGLRMRRAARAVKARLGFEIITVESVGWDTHSEQGGSTGQQASLLAELGDAIAAFWRDLGADGQDVILLTMTEFGRTAAENGSLGTDHGNASAWLASGPSVRGGIYLGRDGWLGLSRDALRDGRDLAHTLEFKDLMAEILLQHFAVGSTASILPGHSVEPVGFL